MPSQYNKKPSWTNATCSRVKLSGLALKVRAALVDQSLCGLKDMGHVGRARWNLEPGSLEPGSRESVSHRRTIRVS